jgi:menaquinone-dependent protoporphyrinogen oxidase
MKVLVAYASRHGATRGIAERIAAKLEQLGCDVTLLPVDGVDEVAVYDAVVVGSSVYFGMWSKDAAELVRRNAHALRHKPVWLFSSGPVGDMDLPPPKEVAEFEDLIKPRGHQGFAGAIDHSKLGMGEKLMVKGLHAPEGDFRDWNAIDGWAQRILEEIRVGAVA